MCRFASVHGITLRFIAFQPRCLLYESPGRILYVRARRRLCGRGGSGGPRSLLGRLRKVSGVFLLRGGGGVGGGTDGGCNRRSRWGMLLIHVFHLQPLLPSSDLYSPPVISPDFSLLLQLASELCPPSIHPLSPFTCPLLFCSFLSLHLSYIPMVHLGCGCQLRPR